MNNLGVFNIDLVKMDQIVITNAAIDNKAQLSSLEKGKHEFSLTYGFVLGHNISDKKFRVIFSCNINTLNENYENIDVSAKFDIAFLYRIENLDELITKKNEKDQLFEINEDLVTSLTNLSYSTSRGIIYSKCQSTIIKNLILPILSTSKLLEILKPTNKEIN